MRVTAPSTHNMIIKLEELGYIERTPGAARSIRLLIDPKLLQGKS
jgi:Mn-dependent DtxR family transcriptional regulator